MVFPRATDDTFVHLPVVVVSISVQSKIRYTAAWWSDMHPSLALVIVWKRKGGACPPLLSLKQRLDQAAVTCIPLAFTGKPWSLEGRVMDDFTSSSGAKHRGEETLRAVAFCACKSIKNQGQKAEETAISKIFFFRWKVCRKDVVVPPPPPPICLLSPSLLRMVQMFFLS